MSSKNFIIRREWSQRYPTINPQCSDNYYLNQWDLYFEAYKFGEWFALVPGSGRSINVIVIKNLHLLYTSA